MSHTPAISIIVAASTNDVIGRDGELPWHLPDDLRRFRQLTTGKPIIMGRKTHESALAAAAGADEVMIIGGSGIYDTFLPMADRIFMTRIHANVDGDVLFPAPDSTEWEQVSLEPHSRDERHAHAFDFTVYARRAASDATG
jgi:dihydrofolate reductase